MPKQIRLLIGATLTGAVCFLVVRSLVVDWDSITRFDWEIRPAWLFFSAVLVWIDFVLLFHLWRVLLKASSGYQLRFSAAYRISVLANLGKYIPGKVWTVAGMVYLLGEEGIPVQPALVSSALHQAFTLIPGAIFITAVLGIKVWGTDSVIGVVGILAAGILVLYPPVFRRLLNFGLQLFRRPAVQFELPFYKAFVLFWLYIVAWVIYGASFWCMTIGLGILGGPFWPVTAAYGAAYLVGFLALFAPGGLGVREGMLAILLAPYLPVGLSSAIAVMSRFWMTVVELAGLIPVALGYGKPKKESDPQSISKHDISK